MTAHDLDTPLAGYEPLTPRDLIAAAHLSDELWLSEHLDEFLRHVPAFVLDDVGTINVTVGVRYRFYLGRQWRAGEYGALGTELPSTRITEILEAALSEEAEALGFDTYNANLSVWQQKILDELLTAATGHPKYIEFQSLDLDPDSASDDIYDVNDTAHQIVEDALHRLGFPRKLDALRAERREVFAGQPADLRAQYNIGVRGLVATISEAYPTATEATIYDALADDAQSDVSPRLKPGASRGFLVLTTLSRYRVVAP